jgi:hypothetical protein
MVNAVDPVIDVNAVGQPQPPVDYLRELHVKVQEHISKFISGINQVASSNPAGPGACTQQNVE